jgi:glyoxylase-like metal-dependent hydrolase (beta-lactamase superfamily II)
LLIGVLVASALVAGFHLFLQHPALAAITVMRLLSATLMGIALTLTTRYSDLLQVFELVLLPLQRVGFKTEALALQRSAGWDEDVLAQQAAKGWGRFGRMLYPMPISYHRIKDGDVLDFGAHQWRVVVGSGHSPEHACLWNEAEGVLVSGDQVLPRISSNVSVNISEPDADPLGEWLASIDKLLAVLPDDLLVCPAHGEPFKGLHTRLIALRDEHFRRLDQVHAAIGQQPLRTIDCFPLLFNRKIGEDHRELATGEAIAHLHRLMEDGRARREMTDGVYWYSAA